MLFWLVLCQVFLSAPRPLGGLVAGFMKAFKRRHFFGGLGFSQHVPRFEPITLLGTAVFSSLFCSFSFLTHQLVCSSLQNASILRVETLSSFGASTK